MLRFAYRLAKDLGMICEEMMERMSALELYEWMAFYEFENDGWPEPEQTPEQIHEAMSMLRAE